MWTEFVEGPVMEVCERGNIALGFTDCCEFLDQLSDY